MTTRTVDGLVLFPDAGAARQFLLLLAGVCARFDWELLAYCLMRNHVHLLVGTPRPTLGDGMRRLQGMTAQRLNRSLGRRGSVWGERYHSRLVQTEDHLLQAAAYIVVNPIKAGLVDHPQEWPWSSYRATAGHTVAPPFLAVDRLLGVASRDPESARAAYEGLVEAEAHRARAGARSVAA